VIELWRVAVVCSWDSDASWHIAGDDFILRRFHNTDD